MNPRLDFDKVAYEQSLARFMAQAWPRAREPDRYQTNWHIDCMCDYLTAAIDWQIGNLLIFTLAPGHMKSLGINVFLPAWLWAQDAKKGFPNNPYAIRPGSWRGPGARLIYMGYQQGLIREHAQKNIDLIQSPWYQRLWSGRFKIATAGVDKFTNDRGGMRQSFSFFGGITGFGAQIICLDDVHNVQSDSYEADRLKVISSWDSALPSRLRSAEHGLFVLSMQRTAENDLIGHILEHDFGGVHVCLPYEFEQKHPYLFMRDLSDEQKKFCGTLLDRPVIRQSDSSGGEDAGPRIGEVWEDKRQEGEVLWPAMWPKDKIEERTKTTPAHQKAGQYQQRPTAAEGGMFKRELFSPRQPLGDRVNFIEMRKLKIVRAWDLAWTEPEAGKDPDWTVGVLMGVSPEDLYYVLDVFRARLTPAQLTDAVIQMAAIDGPLCRVRIPEDPAAGKFVSYQLVQKLAGYEAFAEREQGMGNKAQRAAPFLAALEHRFVVICEGEWNEPFVDEFCSFRVDMGHRHDDQVDACCAAFRACVRRPTWAMVAA